MEMERQPQTPRLLDQVRNVLRLHHYLEGVKGFHEQDLAEGHGAVYLPYALECGKRLWISWPDRKRHGAGVLWV